VFTANAAVVLDRKVLLARFRHPERQAEETHFEAAFRRLQAHGVLDSVTRMPDGITLEGAGDCVFDQTRGVFWMGHGPRTDQRARPIVADLFATDVICDTRGVKFKLNGRRDVFVPLLGRHTAANALAAIAVARRVGLSEELIIESLSHATGPDMRLQIQHLGAITLLNDAYNANPASMQAALKTLLELRTDGRRIAILGDMRELGDSADRLHKEMGQFVSTCDLDLLICIGEKSSLIAAEAIDNGFSPEKIIQYPTTAMATVSIAHHIHRGDLVLLKGSRYMSLEKLVVPLSMIDARRAAS
jgi:UDP-N-acetylmuramyl pentapeptide synthase